MPDSLRKIHKSKTLIFGYALILFGALQQSDLLTQIIPSQYIGLALALVGFTVNILREFTNKPLNEK